MSELGPDFTPAPQRLSEATPQARPPGDPELDAQAEVHAGSQPTPVPDEERTVRIVQGHPTGFEPDANKGGQNGAPKPDGRSASDVLAAGPQADPLSRPPQEQTPATDALPPGGADAGAGLDDPGCGGD